MYTSLSTYIYIYIYIYIHIAIRALDGHGILRHASDLRARSADALAGRLD